MSVSLLPDGERESLRGENAKRARVSGLRVGTGFAEGATLRSRKRRRSPA
jgi:hypothetical protein